MTQNQENKLSMYLATLVMLEKNRSIWQDIPAIVQLVDNITKQVGLLQKAVKKQTEKRKGIALDKSSSRQAMADQAILVGGMVKAYANAVENYQLEESVNYSNTSFTNGKDTLAKEQAEIIWDKASEYATQLADYGLTQADLDDLDNIIEEYADLISSPRIGITDRKESTGSIRQLITQIDNLLKKQLDLLLVRYKSTAFYPTYQAARIIVDQRGKKRKPALTDDMPPDNNNTPPPNNNNTDILA